MKLFLVCFILFFFIGSEAANGGAANGGAANGGLLPQIQPPSGSREGKAPRPSGFKAAKYSEGRSIASGNKPKTDVQPKVQTNGAPLTQQQVIDQSNGGLTHRDAVRQNALPAVNGAAPKEEQKQARPPDFDKHALHNPSPGTARKTRPQISVANAASNSSNSFVYGCLAISLLMNIFCFFKTAKPNPDHQALLSDFGHQV